MLAIQRMMFRLGDLLQALSNSGEQSYMKGMKTLEINPRHPLIAELKRQVS